MATTEIQDISHRRGFRRSASPWRHVTGDDRDLFLIGFVILFVELACIRWFAAYVIFLQFFTNIVLIACFLGMSVGCLRANHGSDWLPRFAPLTLMSLSFAILTGVLYKFWYGFAIDVGDQTAPQFVFFGTEWRNVDLAQFVVPIEVFAGVFFVLITLMFVGLGQVLGRCFDRSPNRIRAYTFNILGSLGGIVAFALMCFAGAPPVWWFLLGFLGVGWFLRQAGQLVVRQIVPLAVACILVGLVGTSVHGATQIHWSPYYMVQFEPANGRDITANTISHQQMVAFDEPGASYSLPYLLLRDSGRTSLQNVLIIGAGSGNDVTHALKNGAGHVDAVEIDPVIQSLGRDYHPDRPYDDPRVEVHLDDGRNFLRRTQCKYDVAVYALVDSLILHSSFSNIRLESFLFTREAFRDVRNALTQDGVFVMYNYFRQGWIVERIARMLEEEFGQEPLIFSLPCSAEISPDESQEGRLTVLVAGNTDAVRDAFDRFGVYWLRNVAGPALQENGFLVDPADQASSATASRDGASAEWLRIAPAVLRRSNPAPEMATDNWPFLYLRSRMIPSLSLRGMAVIGVLSLVMLVVLTPGRRLGLNGRMFFLGAAFLLLETKAVVHLALLFGSTWAVNSVVFFAVLVMILAANLYVATSPALRLKRHYLALFVTLGLGCVVPMEVFLAGNLAWKYGGSCLLVFAPIFFAGVIFARSFRDSKHPERDFGANIAGAVTGGLAEYTSMLLGFQHLLLVAICFYALSAFFGQRRIAQAS